MLLSLNQSHCKHINTVTHEGKVVVVATAADGTIWYTVKQDGFEDGYLNQLPDQRTGWEAWKQLELPNESAEDQSVVSKEAAELTYKDASQKPVYLLRSRYTTNNQSAVAPVHLVSGLGHLYVFRQSKPDATGVQPNTLLVDRFVFDGLINKLTPKLEVRFKRSKQKHKPSENQRRGSDGNLANIDSLDFTDINGKPFHEPTTELSLINNLANGWFSVVLLPTSEQDKYRWHVFAYNSATQKVEITTLRASEEGLFEVKDYTILNPEPHSIPGIIKRSLDLGNLAVAKGLTATRYDVQRERETEEKGKEGGKIKQLLRESVRVMLVVGTSAGNVAAISFAVAADGTLSQINDTPVSKIRRNTPRQVLLPLNTLDEIKAIGQSNPPPQGAIIGFARGENDEVVLTSKQTTGLNEAEITQVKITGGKDCNCLYSSVTVINENTFEITSDRDLCGSWEIIPEEETGLIYNGIVTTYQITQEGKLRVTALNHGLSNGEAVQVVNTKDYNGTYTVTKIDDMTFSLDGVRWQAGAVISARLKTEKRRGISFDGIDDYVELSPGSIPIGNEITISFWAKGGNTLPKTNSIIEAKNADGHILNIHLPRIDQKVYFACGTDRIEKSAPQDYQGAWVHWAFTKNAATGEMKIYLNGVLWHSEIDKTSNLPSATQCYLGKGFTAIDQCYEGSISDLCIWNKAQTQDEIGNSMYLQLTGREVGLVGYWRLDAILEGEERKVIDFSVNGKHGTVYGGAYVSAVTLQRNIGKTIPSVPAIKYENEELFAVTERATYTEEFEFKIVKSDNTDGFESKIFAPIYKGKKNRNSQDWTTIEAKETQFELLGNGWYKSSSRFTVPDGVSMVRSFGITDVKGSWNTLDIRKHQIQLVFNSITEKTYTDNLSTLAESDKEGEISDKEGEIFAQNKHITALGLQVEKLKATYQAELTNPLNYWCKLVSRSDETKATRIENYKLVYNSNPAYIDFKFVETDPGYYRIIWTCNGELELYGSPEHIVCGGPSPTGFAYQWKIAKIDGTDYYSIVNRHTDEVLERGDGRNSNNVYAWPGSPTANSRRYWKISITTGPANTKISDALSALNAKQTELDAAERKLSTLKVGQRDLDILPGNQLELQETLKQLDIKLKQLDIKERQEGLLLEEKRKLKVHIAALTLNGDQKTLALNAKNGEILAQENIKTALGLQVEKLKATYQAERTNPLNYWCKLVSQSDETKAARIENYKLVYNSNPAYIDFKFVDTDPGYYRIIWTCNGELELYGSPEHIVWGVLSPTGFAYQWKIAKIDGTDYYSIVNRHTDEVLELGLPPNSSNIYAWPGSPTANSRRYWKISITTGPTNTKISDALSALNAKQTELDAAERKLSTLKVERGELQLSDDDRFAKRTQRETRLEKVISRLTELLREINSLNTNLVDSVKTSQQTSQKMPPIHIDSRGLETQSALLRFVRPASRLSAIETCEGNVQLSYFDDQGRMRQTNFDATYDSTNLTSEQWILDSLRTCLNFDKPSSIVSPSTPIPLDKEWTIEAWFSYPLPETISEWHTLFEGKNGDAPIRVKNGKQLGTWAGQKFNDSGFNIESLSIGWHHLTVSRRNNNTLSYYINGTQAGTEEHVIKFDGVDDHISCPSLNSTFSQGITVEAWVWYDAFQTNSRVVDFGNDQRDNIIFCNQGTSNTLEFSVLKGTEVQSITAPNALQIKEWMHLAATIDASGNAKLYKNGIQIATDPVSLPNSLNRVSNNIGRSNWTQDSYFKGELSEVRIWNKCRTEAEIKATMNQRLSDTTPDLMAYYPLNEIQLEGTNSKVIDRVTKNSGTVVQATIFDTRTLSLKSFDSSGIKDVCAIGNSANSAAAAASERSGKIAEVRIWNVALSAEEIAVNSKTLLTGNEPGLRTYYPFNEATGTEVRDHTGNGYVAQVVGASWWSCTASIGNLNLVHQAVQFNGANAYVELSPSSIPTGNEITISFWVKGGVSLPKMSSILEAKNASGRILNIHLPWVNQKVYFDCGTDRIEKLAEPPEYQRAWVHWAFTKNAATGEMKIYLNGVLWHSETGKTSNLPSTTQCYLGKGFATNLFYEGSVADLRIWNKARTQAEIQADMNKRLIGTEEGLVGYWPLDHIIIEDSTSKVIDLANNRHGTVSQASLISNQNLSIVTDAIVADAIVSSEYSTISQNRIAMIRRFFAAPSSQGVQLLPDKRVEELDLQWIGNGQFAPTLLGYIEGPPPIPSENLTIEEGYNGATSVELALTEDVQFKWTRSEESASGMSMESFVGIDSTKSFGVGAEIEMEFRLGLASDKATSDQSKNESSITSNSSLKMADTLKLCGIQEKTANFPYLGKRFIPKNVGYALVVSALADVFVTRLKRTKKMIGYQVLPAENIPPDVNTVTFLINPAYTMSGSLDGMTGSSATSQRFFKHVPEMRSQFGSLYPASYYRLQEAYALKQKIEEQDKARESYFSQFNPKIFEEKWNEESFQKQVEGGDKPSELSGDQPNNEQNSQSGEAAAKQKQIAQTIQDLDTRANANAGFAEWQTKMEDIKIRAGKRNIVNTYVWDADGGLRTESQSFANTAEHSIGGAFSLNTALGADGHFKFIGALELKVQATASLTQTMTKTETRSRGIQLSVDLGGVESRGITNYDDKPILPGEKVNRYRFMSFYLEGSTNHFNDFFNYVVDPEWLASNSEEARALRQARGKANKTWRVLHRVTYVERPALMGFGRDMRQLPPANSVDDLGQLQAKVNNLEQQNAEMQRKLDAILRKLDPNA